MSDLMVRLDQAARLRARRRRREKVAKRPPRRDIQGLRAVAVLAVILNHLFDWPTGAFVGVDVFFVISGFLITGILVRGYEADGTISARRFYSRRIKRIMPAATLVLLVTVCASLVLLSAARVKTIALDAVSAFFFASNWRFAEQGTDYFMEGLPPSPLQHYWSLSIEEQFYFVWPWLMLLVLIVGTRLFKWERHHGRLVAGILMGGIVVASFAWAMHQTGADPDYAYFSTFTRVWELGAGALLAIAEPKLRLKNVWHRTALGWVGLAGIVASLFVVSASDGFPAPWAALPVAATALVILAGCGGEQPYLQPLTNKPAQYVGNLSYSLYLWHFPVIILLAAVVETHTAAYYTIAVALIAGLSVASYHLVENPARDAAWFDGRRPVEGWQYVVLTALLIPTIALGAYVLTPDRYAPPTTSPFTQLAADADAPGKGLGEPPACVGAAVMAPGSSCDLNEGSAFYPTLDKLLTDDASAYKCWIEKRQPMKVCKDGDFDGATRVAIVGDSHAAMLLPMVRKSAFDLGMQIDSYVGLSCRWHTSPDKECTAMPDIQAALEAGKYDVVITQASRRNAGDDPDPFIDAWMPVAKGGAKIIVIADNPETTQDALDCVARIGFDPAEDTCATSREVGQGTPDLLVEAAKQVPNASVIDLSDFFCDDKECPSVIGNVLVYRDTMNHMTGTFSLSLAPYLADELEPLLG